MRVKFLLSTLLLFYLLTTGVHAEHSHEVGPHSICAEATAGERDIPPTLPELWTAIRDRQASLSEAIGKKDGSAAHRTADVLLEHMKALPSRLEGLPGVEGEALKRVVGQTNNLAKLYEAIHHAAEEGDFDGAAKGITKAAAVLDLIERLIPLEK